MNGSNNTQNVYHPNSETSKFLADCSHCSTHYLWKPAWKPITNLKPCVIFLLFIISLSWEEAMAPTPSKYTRDSGNKYPTMWSTAVRGLTLLGRKPLAKEGVLFAHPKILDTPTLLFYFFSPYQSFHSFYFFLQFFFSLISLDVQGCLPTQWYKKYFSNKKVEKGVRWIVGFGQVRS